MSATAACEFMKTAPAKSWRPRFHDWFFFIFLQLCMLSLSAEARGSFAESQQARAMILGASLSSSQVPLRPRAKSPLPELCRMLGLSCQNLAYAGSNSEDQLRRLKASLQNSQKPMAEGSKYSFIFALDLFFHDKDASTIPKTVKHLCHQSERLIIGNVFDGQASYSESATTKFKNTALAEAVEKCPGAMLVDLRKIYFQLFSDEGLPFDEKAEGSGDIVLRAHDVLADGLHPNALGAQLLAQLLRVEIARRYWDSSSAN